MKYFDAHCHVQFPIYDEDRDAVLARMREAEVGGLIVGTDLGLSRAAVALARQANFFASVGLHPNHEADEWYEEKNYLELANDPVVRAIGECGLDYYRPEDANDEVKRKQKAVFADHIALAVKTGKSLMIHARPSKGTVDAYADALDMLEEAQKTAPALSGNFHFFVGDIATAARIVSLGFTCSFTAVLTFTQDYDEVIRSLPLENILTETDAPYVAPAQNRGKRNEPTAVIEVVRAIARIRGEDEEVIRTQLLANAVRILGLPFA